MSFLSDLAGWLGRCGRESGAPFAEALEPRLALSDTPLPTPAMMEDVGNPVIRMEVKYGAFAGDIDIELYQGSAPITAANFLAYVTSGRLSETFFHRLAAEGTTTVPFVLQGGGFSFDNATGLASVSTDAPIIREITGKSNLERTIAMARSTIDSATSQFYFNISDNTELDPTGPGSGYAVFGRVIQGWETVQTVSDLTLIRDLQGDAAFAGPDNGAFGEVPTQATYNAGTGVREADLLQLVKAEVIKPSGSNTFYTFRVVHPDGYMSPYSTETLDLVNYNAFYQVLLRYERAGRDVVAQSGSITANSRLSIPLSTLGGSNLGLRTLEPYALVVTSAIPSGVTSPRAVAADVVRTDFGAELGDAFFDPSGHSNADLMNWTFGRIERGPTSREYMVWQNLSSEATTVTVTLYAEGRTPISVDRTLEPYRRGGLRLFELGLSDDTYGARVTATQPIAVMVSDFDLPALGVGGAVSTPAWSAFGVPGTATSGTIAAVSIIANWTSVISVVNPNAGVAVVGLDFIRTDGSVTETTLPVLPTSRDDLVLTTAMLGIPEGERFTIRYDSNLPVGLHYTSVDEQGRNQSAGHIGDGGSTRVLTHVGSTTVFGSGFFDPTRSSNSDVYSVTNPYRDAAITFSFFLRFHFSDGSAIDTAAQVLAPLGRADVAADSVATVLAKISSGTGFRSYSVRVMGTATIGATPVESSGVAVRTRLDTLNGRAVISSGTVLGTLTPLSDGVFGPTGGGGI